MGLFSVLWKLLEIVYNVETSDRKALACFSVVGYFFKNKIGMHILSTQDDKIKQRLLMS